MRTKDTLTDADRAQLVAARQKAVAAKARKAAQDPERLRKALNCVTAGLALGVITTDDLEPGRVVLIGDPPHKDES